MHTRLLAVLGLVLALAIPALALSDPTPAEHITSSADASVHVTPDRIAEIPFYLQSCTNSVACVAPVALYSRSGQRLTQTAPAAFLPGPPGSGQDTAFPGFRLTRGAWRTLERKRSLTSRVIIRFPNGATQLLGYETLLPPTPRQSRWCSGLLQRLGPPCHGAFR
jgi:hypothetical protein